MVPERQQPHAVILGSVLTIGLGVLLVMSVVFMVPGVILIAYGVCHPLFAAWDIIWGRVEALTDWWMEGR
jgi:hypothetical protein